MGELAIAHGTVDERRGPSTGAILVIEDDRELRELLEVVLTEDGHRPATAPDGPAALELLARGGFQPDLFLRTTICRMAWTGFSWPRRLEKHSIARYRSSF